MQLVSSEAATRHWATTPIRAAPLTRALPQRVTRTHPANSAKASVQFRLARLGVSRRLQPPPLGTDLHRLRRARLRSRTTSAERTCETARIPSETQTDPPRYLSTVARSHVEWPTGQKADVPP